jgi:hypothetical protein
LSVREDFPSADRLSNDWALIGSPEFNSPEITMAATIIPDFEPDDGGRYTIMTASETNEDSYFVSKEPTNTLRVDAGNTTVITVPFANWSPYFRRNERNTIVFGGTSGDNWLMFNGVVVGMSTTAWTTTTALNLYMGVLDSTLDGFFCGTIKEVKVFKQKLTQQEAIDYHNNETYCWRSKAVVDLPMLQAQHDPPLTLDVSGNGNHGTLSGVVKLDRRGYKDNGSSSFIEMPTIPDRNDFVWMSLLKFEETGTDQVIATNGAGFIFRRLSSGIIRATKQTIGGGDSDRPTYLGTHHTVALVVSSTDGISTYIDGVLAGNDSNTEDSPVPGSLRLGKSSADSWWHKGEYHQFMMLRGTFTPTQVYDAHHQMRTQARMI